MYNPELTPDSFLQLEVDAHLSLLKFIDRAPGHSMLLPTPDQTSLSNNPYLTGFAAALAEEVQDPELSSDHLVERTSQEALQDGVMFALAKLVGHAEYFKIPQPEIENIRDPEETENTLDPQPLAALACTACLFMGAYDTQDAYAAAKSEPVILLPADEQTPERVRTPFQAAIAKKVESIASITKNTTSAEACQQGILLALGCISLTLERSANSILN